MGTLPGMDYSNQRKVNTEMKHLGLIITLVGVLAAIYLAISAVDAIRGIEVPVLQTLGKWLS